MVSAEETTHGFIGIAVPALPQLRAVLTGGTGLELGSGILVRSPVSIAAGLGLFLLWRRGFAREAIVCLTIVALLIVIDAGYAFPYGGTSPGPRYLAPMLPFLLLGLCEAFRRWPLPTVALSLLSIGSTTRDALHWDIDNQAPLGETVWSLLGTSKPVGAALVYVAAVAAGLFVAGVVLRRGMFRARSLPEEASAAGSAPSPLPH